MSRLHLLFALPLAVTLSLAAAQAAEAPAPSPAAAAAPAPAAAPADPANMVRYVATYGEYSLLLPEAPQVQTLWAGGSAKVPYLDQQPEPGVAGETATYKRVDPDTGDSFEVRVTTIRAPESFLSTLTEQGMTDMLDKEFTGLSLDRRQASYSGGSKTLKWATVSGYHVDKENHLFFDIAHYLAGLNSVTVVRISYNLENPGFQKYYDTIGKSIAYVGN